mgnify:CR=1 FL=1
MPKVCPLIGLPALYCLDPANDFVDFAIVFAPSDFFH